MTEVKDKVTSLDGRVDMLSNTVKDMKKTLDAVNQRDFEDSNATSQDIVNLKKRVKTLEKQPA
ncbi:MAG: hypothetical protein COU28_00910 [Candidatus Magasanikbacteria bacterium CG10_big_fil_rev_8_21_14_0_10_36_16]|uniref:Uncharacterized protein n=1 Tax=Candidatus Magasanikbacteria bacterium CG10_big_fil_rev_8_21_14_0_10_36_16 TaxID=1974645 RepID=A0A2H0TZB7_9BACT|nr:MAG: hypothetical protein COU28_00910 [Candidatus Magasanikbacteria bacterium CG10_big_fil_rev_8_21_14_0_10_36_16]